MCNCLKYLKLSLRFSVTSSMLTASILAQGAGWAGASRPAFFLGDPIFFLEDPVFFSRGPCIFPRGCCWICLRPTATWEQDPLRGRRVIAQQHCKMLVLEGSSGQRGKKKFKAWPKHEAEILHFAVAVLALGVCRVGHQGCTKRLLERRQ